MLREDRQLYIDGQFVSERIAQVVQAIREYSIELDVEWCPPGQRRPDQAAFKIIHRPAGGEPYVIFHVKTEEEFDARVLKRIIAGDQRNGELTMSEVEAAEEAAKRVAHQRFLDEMEEAHEIAHAVMKSNKSTYKVNKNLTIKDYLPGNHASKPKSF
jgi:hypothetical protein